MGFDIGGGTPSTSEITLESLLKYAGSRKASDIFIKAEARPTLKVDGRIEHTELPPVGDEESRRIAYARMTPDQCGIYERDHELNISFAVPGVARIRQNIYRQRGTVATTCRLIPLEVRSLDDLGIESKAIESFTECKHGLVLVTGPTGSGKTTTLAAMIDRINSTRAANIITIEDPIEYVHRDKQAVISQREVGIDTHSFKEALRQVLRQTPDVILVGELRDADTLDVALQAAETGHLVFSTLHTSSAAETLDRISNMYPPHEREMLWLRLSVTLRGVVSQKLLRRADGAGRIAAMEIMVATPTIAKQLEDGRSDDIYGAMRQDGQEGYWGMQTMNQCLDRYVAEELIAEDAAMAAAGNLAEMKQMLRRTSSLKELVEAA